MAQKILDVLMLGRCSHEFSWPRRAADGHYYQVCVHCAVEYKYDWNSMRRVERVDLYEAVAEPVSHPERISARKPSWVPRARRLHLNSGVRYRAKNGGNWQNGTIENLSQSGVLLRGPEQLPDNTLVEMMFEMPEEISGQKNSTVLCQGRIIRAMEPELEKNAQAGEFRLAATILDYRFLNQN